MNIEFKNGGEPADPIAAIETIGKRFEEFKAANDKRLAEVEKKGSADVLTTEQVDKINAELSRLSDLSASLEKKAARPSRGDGGPELSADQQEHKQAFDAYVRKGKDNGLAEIEQKAMSVGVNADGGFAVPEELDRTIYDMVKEISALRSICNVVQVGTQNYEKLVNLHGTASGWVAETAARPETNSPQFASIVPPTGELYANPSATRRILEDAMFDVESWLAGEIALEFAKAEGAAFISGNGTDKPQGFLSGAPVATADGARAFGVLEFVASGGAAALPTSADVYIGLVYKLKAAHRAMASWVTSKAVLENIRKMKATDNQYLWQPSLQAGQPSTFLGYAVTEAEDMPAVAANAFPLAFGNFKAGYTITERRNTVIIRDELTNKPYVSFYATKRVGGKVIDSEAIKLLKCAV